MRQSITDAFKRLCFFFGSFLTCELLLHCMLYTTVSWQGFCIILIFTLCYALAAEGVCGFFPGKGGFLAAFAVQLITSLLFSAQYVYYMIFKTPMLVYSVLNVWKVAEFAGEGMRSALQYWQWLVFLLPLAVLCIFWRKTFCRQNIGASAISLMLATAVFVSACFALQETDRLVPGSPYNVFYNESNQPAAQKTLGVITATGLDLQRTLWGFEPKDGVTSVGSGEAVSGEADYAQNVLDIDFQALADSTEDAELKTMHSYFAGQTPTYQNEYTGMLEGKNLIFIVAESLYYPLLEHPELYPNLCRMAEEGWNFTNYYEPLFNVSTSDGEYVALTGLLPKSGVWSFSESRNNYLPLVLGNQFDALGYDKVIAYHDHTFDYYDRDMSHPNLGYDYYGIGNGLDVKVIWPESDLEMAQVTAPTYGNGESFHIYYLTVSGHLEYNFGGNNMALRHKDEVADQPYSDSVRAYLACNIELDEMLGYLMDSLEARGELENTVIAITADHYPYGLENDAVDELVGHTVDKEFELYRNAFLIWTPGMEPMENDTLMCAVDILPTLSNLFALPYDSRLLMGTDVFSGARRLVAFNDRSWISDLGRYNANTGQASAGLVPDYLNKMNARVSAEFIYSAKILERDYYRIVWDNNPAWQQPAEETEEAAAAQETTETAR